MIICYSITLKFAIKLCYPFHEYISMLHGHHGYVKIDIRTKTKFRSLYNKKQDYKYPHFKGRIVSSKGKGKIFWTEYLCYEMFYKTSTIHTIIATLQSTRLCVIYKQTEFEALNRPHFTCWGVTFQNVLNIMCYTLREWRNSSLASTFN